MDELIKTRNKIANKYLKLQAKDILECRTGDEICKRIDDLYDSQMVIKAFDNLIRYFGRNSADFMRWNSVESCETWKPQITKLKNYINN